MQVPSLLLRVQQTPVHVKCAGPAPIRCKARVRASNVMLARGRLQLWPQRFQRVLRATQVLIHLLGHLCV